MNERIKELIKSLGIIPEDEHYEVAELIVKECIDAVENVTSGYIDYRSQIQHAMREYCVEAIQDRFELKNKDAEYDPYNTVNS